MNSSKTGLFLMELIISILFFALSSAVCIQLFAKSHLIDKATTNSNTAVVKCENFCEIYSGILDETTDPDSIEQKLFDLSKSTVFGYDDTIEANVYETYYNEDWSICERSEARMIVEFKDYGFDEESCLFKGEACVYQIKDGSKDVLYSLPITKHIADTLK